MIFSADETAEVGIDLVTPVVEAIGPEARSPFNGQACASSGKRLPTSAEWQQAVVGSPDPVGDNGTTDCNTVSAGTVNTGSRSSCVSTIGAHDMVGNVHEWVVDWVPLSTAAPGWGALSNDYMSLSGASTAANSPAALLRGGHFQNNAVDAGPLTVDAGVPPAGVHARHGFRCTR